MGEFHVERALSAAMRVNPDGDAARRQEAPEAGWRIVDMYSRPRPESCDCWNCERDNT